MSPMGWKGHAILQTNWNAVGLIKTIPECQDDSASLEGNGLIYVVYTRYLRQNKARAETQARHVHDGQPLTMDSIQEMAKEFLEEMQLYKLIFTKRLLVVFEGFEYFFKRAESAARALKAATKWASGCISEAWRVCDCLAKLIIFEMMKAPGLYGEACVAVCEADAQIAFNCAAGITTYAVCTSGDADYLVGYPGMEKVIFSPELRRATSRKPLVLQGVLIIKGRDIRKPIAVLLEKGHTKASKPNAAGVVTTQQVPPRLHNEDFSQWSDFKLLLLPCMLGEYYICIWHTSRYMRSFLPHVSCL